MKQIILKVDGSLGEKQRTASNRLKVKLSKPAEKQIDKAIDAKKEGDSVQYFNELRDGKAEKGLAREILDDILIHSHALPGNP